MEYMRCVVGYPWEGDNKSNLAFFTATYPVYHTPNISVHLEQEEKDWK